MRPSPLEQEQEKTRPEGWKRMERLLSVQKRKRAYGGRSAEVKWPAALPQPEAEQRGERDR